MLLLWDFWKCFIILPRNCQGCIAPLLIWISHIYMSCILFLLSIMRMQSLNQYVRLWSPNSKKYQEELPKIFILTTCMDLRIKPSVLTTTLDHYYLNFNIESSNIQTLEEIQNLFNSIFSIYEKKFVNKSSSSNPQLQGSSSNHVTSSVAIL